MCAADKCFVICTKIAVTESIQKFLKEFIAFDCHREKYKIMLHAKQSSSLHIICGSTDINTFLS